MASILAEILDGKITSEDLTDPHETLRNEDVKGEEEKLEQCHIAELVPFLLNYLREKASHHLTPRQSAAITPKKTSVSQAKRANSASEHTQHAAKNSRGNLFPSQKTPSPSPVTPLSQSRRDKLHEYRSSPSSSPHVRRKSPKAHGSDRDRQSQLVTQPKLNIDDPDDFPPMGSASKKVTPSRRITPTQVKSDGKKGKVSPAFSSSPFSSPHTVLESYGSPVSLQEERNMLKLERARKKNKGDFTWGNRISPSPQSSVRSPPPHVLGDFIVSPPKQSTTSDHLEKSHSKPNDSLLSTPSPCKDPSGETCSDNGATGATSPQQFEEETHKEKAQFIQVDKDKVVFHHKLDALAKVYSRCILANLVPNVTAELYFVMQLLTARGIVSEQQQDSENGKLGEIHSQNILGSIHNCTYFAVAVLQEIQRLIFLLDKETLHLLADNPRIADFSPSLKETFLQQYKAYSVTKVSQVNFIKSPLGGVPFSVERDNKQNFPTERAFHNFNKQRDVFYELVRKWEDSHCVAGWNMEEHMGDRIRALVNQKPEVANYSHFARLFKSQLLQMCEEEKNGSDFRSSSMLSNLQKSNPEKFQRLQERFITPLSTSGPCPSPSFSNVQEFFKGFIQSAASHSFNQHLIDLLIVKITEIDDKEFPLLDIEVSEKDLSIQNKELKHDFSGCLMNVRILAKFLGFLLFQPYYGAETTSQVITTETLKIRNRIPVQFDILSYLKKAWYSGRLVLTIPWAVEYLSMMDPLAPHLGYFSRVLYWLQRIYREIAAQSAKRDLNHSRLLLVSCLGWFFEIPVIPVSFFFKSLTDSKQPIDEDLKSTSSDVKVSLDSSGIVDQGILYSCCPYLGEIRSVLVEAAAGLSGRAGPVKKITPVSAGEPARISSSQRQLQLQLEENFFRIQPDFLKRLSDFTVERLCSNIISHVKGNIIPSLLGRGVQRIQEFLDNEFSGNANTDQAKEKCRPHVLKIIHSVTDDGVKTALETVESSKQKSLSAFESLCPQEMNSKVITTAANITTRLIKEKTSDWINTCLPNIMEEGLFVQFDKIANSILNSKSKEPRIRDSQSDANTKQIPENVCEVKAKCCKQPGGCLPESATPAMKVKALQAVLSEQSKLLAMQSPSEITPEVVAAVVALESTLISEGQSYAKEMALIGQITVELVFILVCRTAYGVTVVETNCTKNSCGILDKLTKLWTRLKERHIEVPFERLLSNPHVNLIMTIDNRKVVFEALQALFLSLIRKHLICSHEVEQWYISALGLATDKGTAVELCTTSCSLVLAYHEARKRNGSGDESHKTVHQADFSLLLAALIQRFPHNSSVSSLLSECVKNNPGVIVISDDYAIN